MKFLTWQNPEQLFVAQVLIKILNYSVAEIRYMIFLQLFIVFIQIGIFGFGGGYSMISLIQGQVVTQYHWMTMQEFTDVVAISQMTPGPIGINTATYCGYTAVHNA